MAAKTKAVALEAPDVQMIALDQIHPSPINPRKHFDEDAIAELAASIAEHGLLQPITVAPWTDGYVIVAGERRWRACSQLQLATVPCIIRPVGTDKEHLQLALIENLQRTDIDPIEEAAGYRQLMDLGLKQREIAEKVHRQQPAVAKAIGLLDLPADVQELISKGDLSPSHGVVLSSYRAFPDVASALARTAAKQQTPVSTLQARGVALLETGDPEQLRKSVVKMGWPDPPFFSTCKQCPFNAYRAPGSDPYSTQRYCLKPDHFRELQEQAEEKQRAAFAANTGHDPEAMLKLNDMDYRTYERLDVGTPSGCTTACECRRPAVDYRGRTVYVCTDPAHFRKLKTAQTKEENKVRKERVAGELETVLAAIQEEGLSKRTLAPVVRTAITGPPKDVLRQTIEAHGWPITVDALTFQHNRDEAYEELMKLTLSEMVTLAIEVMARNELQKEAEGRLYGGKVITEHLLAVPKRPLAQVEAAAEAASQPDDEGFRALAAAVENNG